MMKSSAFAGEEISLVENSLTERMIERLEDEFDAKVDTNACQIEFPTPLGGTEIVPYDPDHALESIQFAAKTYDEGAEVLARTVERPLQSYWDGLIFDDATPMMILQDAEQYKGDLHELISLMKQHIAEGWGDEQFEDWIGKDRRLFSQGTMDDGFKIGMDSGDIEYESFSVYPEICYDRGKMTARDVLEALENEDRTRTVSDVVCDTIGVSGPANSNHSMVEIIRGVHSVRKTLESMSDMLEEERELEENQSLER